MKVFNNPTINSSAFLKENGYVHYQINSNEYSLIIKKCYEYYACNEINSSNAAFRTKDGKPRHYVDVFRDKFSETLNLFSSQSLQNIIEHHVAHKNRLVFSHSKLSIKHIGSDSSWHPHQDNGYEPKNKNHNNFAIFICLEDMNENNGCLQIYPKSHKYGTLKHERLVEDHKTGDNQLYVKDIPCDIKPMSIIANKGDIILFLADTLHGSLSTKTPSKRMSIITGVEEFNVLKLDNYGKLPLFIRGKLDFLEIIYLLLFKLFSPQLYWKYIKKNKMLAALIRKIMYAAQ
jgi:ectoine hydroxylase-related dioxygenase (phytanoyl-CoA dioxygenase family)